MGWNVDSLLKSFALMINKLSVRKMSFFFYTSTGRMKNGPVGQYSSLRNKRFEEEKENGLSLMC